MNYEDKFMRLGILPPKYRREMSDLILLLKCQKDCTDIESTKYFKKVSAQAYKTLNFCPNNFCVRIAKQEYIQFFLLIVLPFYGTNYLIV